jgi:hypothetical protein
LLLPRDAIQGLQRIRVDLVREGIAWFEDLGGETIEIPLPR